MDIWELLREALGQSLVAPLVSLVILPIVYRVIGVSKRQQREREQQAIRTAMDLARGFGDLAREQTDPAKRAGYEAMRTQVLADFDARVGAHFRAGGLGEAIGDSDVYYIVPPIRGFFGAIWTVLAVLAMALFVMSMAAIGFASVQDTASELSVKIFAFVLLAIILGGPMLLLRWFAFLSFRRALRSSARGRPPTPQRSTP